MARVTIGRIFDSAKALGTKAGRELSELILFLSDFAEQTLRILRNGVTLKENIDGTFKTLILKHNTAQQIDTNGRRPSAIHFSHVTNFPTAIDSYAFYYDPTGAPTVKLTFVGSPTEDQHVVVYIYF